MLGLPWFVSEHPSHFDGSSRHLPQPLPPALYAHPRIVSTSRELRCTPQNVTNNPLNLNSEVIQTRPHGRRGLKLKAADELRQGGASLLHAKRANSLTNLDCRRCDLHLPDLQMICATLALTRTRNLLRTCKQTCKRRCGDLQLPETADDPRKGGADGLQGRRKGRRLAAHPRLGRRERESGRAAGLERRRCKRPQGGLRRRLQVL